MAVTGMANLAIKVADLDAACDFYERAGAEVRDRMVWGNGERADVYLGPVQITLFTKAIYEDAVTLPKRAFSILRFSRTISTRSSKATRWFGGRRWSKAYSVRGVSRSWKRQVASGSSSWSSSNRRRAEPTRVDPTLSLEYERRTFPRVTV